MDIKLDTEALQTLLQKSIVDSLGEVGQKTLIAEMVRYMTTPPSTSGHGTYKPVSPLMGALRVACETAAATYLREKFVNDSDFRTQLDSLYSEATKRFFEGDGREATINRIADRMSRAFEDR